MGKVWRAAKSVLGLHMCRWSLPADSDDYPSDELDSPAHPSHSASSNFGGSAPGTPGRSSPALQLTRNSLRLSKGVCAICLEAMKAGTGQALFTAECSHTFHFSCIASNVRHGSMVCPVCRARWKEVPWQAPPSPRHNNRDASSRQRSHSNLSMMPSPARSPFRSFVVQDDTTSQDEQDPVIRIIDESIANAQSIRSPPAALEPTVYDDDEAVVDSSTRRGNDSSGEGTSESDESLEFEEESVEESKGNNTVRTKVEVSTYAEVGSVSYSEARESFTVLVHVKAPQSNAGQQQQQSETVSNSTDSSSAVGASLILDPSRRAPLDLVTVLDVSGSMAGTKLLLLKRAMSFVIRNLSAHDRLSVIVFSSSAKRLFPLKCMVEEGRQHALRAIDTLVCTGGTNIAEGLRKGAKVLEERRRKNPVASIMLLSDGQDTYSMGTRGQVFSSVRSAAEHHKLLPGSIRHGLRSNGDVTRIPVHTFGFGADHDAATMHSISEVSGGTFSFIQAEGGVQDAFAQCVGGLLSVLVQDVQLVMTTTSMQHMPCQGIPHMPSQGIQIKGIQAGSYSSTLCDDSSKGIVKLGDLYADEERDVLVELKLPALGCKLEQAIPILEIGCKYTDPVHHELRHTKSQKLSISRPEIVTPDQQSVSVEVDRQKNRLLAAQKIGEAGILAEAGDIEAAQRTLHSAQVGIQGSLAFQRGDQLAKALEAELGEIQLRIGSRQMYERSGRAYILSAQSSHLRQRATTRGHSVEGYSSDYQTPSMTGMILRSQLHLTRRVSSTLRR